MTTTRRTTTSSTTTATTAEARNKTSGCCPSSSTVTVDPGACSIETKRISPPSLTTTASSATSHFEADPLREPLLLPAERLAAHDDDDQRVMSQQQPETSDGRNGILRISNDNDDTRDAAEPVHDATTTPQHPQHTPWYKNPYQRMAMISNFGTSYNAVNISLVLPILEQAVTPAPSTQDTSAVASSLLAGMILGQVLGGALGDSFLGLTGALRVVMVLQIAASLGSASVVVVEVEQDQQLDETEQQESSSFYRQLALWRFVLGMGAGAVYPLAACLSVEHAGLASGDHVKSALKRVVRTFAMQGVGFWAVPALAWPLLRLRGALALNVIWRVLLGVGCLPGLLLLYWQWQLSRRTTTERPKHGHHHHQRLPGAEPGAAGSERTTEGQDASRSGSSETVGDNELLCEDSDGEVGTFLDSSPGDMSSGGEGCYGDTEPPAIRHGWWASIVTEANVCQKLMGTAVTWFLVDVLFYGNTLFQPLVLEAAFGTPEQRSVNDTHDAAGHRRVLERTALDQWLLTSIALPGYVVAGLVMGQQTWCGIAQSPRYVMLQGFLCMSVLYLIIGALWRDLRHHYPVALLLLYGLTFFFANYGPNTTTFVLPSLVYSAECRSTFNGLSAAAGKVGAWCGATLFAPAAQAYGDGTVMYWCAAIGAVAFGLTYCFVRVVEEEPGPPQHPVSHVNVGAEPPQPETTSSSSEEDSQHEEAPPAQDDHAPRSAVV